MTWRVYSTASLDVAGIGEYGHLELVVSQHDSIWIVLGALVEAAGDAKPTI
jgi:hypothetical protein